MNQNDFQKVKSTIAIKTSKGVQAIQVMYNGSFDLMGKKLLAHYMRWQNTLQMMKKGNIVVLGDNLKEYDPKKNANGTLDLTQMKKDRIPHKVYKNIADLLVDETDSQYIYFWDTDKWYGLKVDEKPYFSYFDLLTNLV